MPRTCDRCEVAVHMSTDCSYCGGTFCSDHVLPENHTCSGLVDSETLGPDFRAYGDEILTRESSQRYEQCGRLIKTNRRICHHCRTSESAPTEPNADTLTPSSGGANTCKDCGRATSTQYDRCFRCRRGNSTDSDDSATTESHDSGEPRHGVRLVLFVVGIFGLGGAVIGPYGFLQQPLVYLIPAALILPYVRAYYNLF